MPRLVDKKWDAFVEAIEAHVSWSRGVGSEWSGDALVSADFLAELVYLAFEAPISDRDQFYGAVLT